MERRLRYGLGLQALRLAPRLGESRQCGPLHETALLAPGWPAARVPVHD